MRNPHGLLIVLILSVYSCGTSNPNKEVTRDLKQIKRDTLRIMIAPGKLGMDVRGKRSTGLEYSILSEFTSEYGHPFKFISVTSADSMAAYLRNGKGDIAAGLFSPDFVESERLAHSCSYNTSQLVSVSLKPDPWYGDYWGHRGFPALINEDRSVHDTLYVSHVHADATNSICTNSALAPDHLLQYVSNGYCDGALCPRILFDAYEGAYPHLNSDTEDHGQIELVFAMRKRSPHLKGALDSWLGNAVNWTVIDALVSAYSDSRRLKGSFSHPHHKGTDNISSYDEFFKIAADSTGLDWRLLAAVAFKESRFNPDAESHMGALGLMQLMPSTAIAIGVDSAMGEAGAIIAASAYLRSLERMFRKSVPDPNQRIAFALAAYNAGPGHVMDAQRIAEENGLDPSKWHHHVERAMLLLTRPEHYRSEIVENGFCMGNHVFLFVREVQHYWEHYRQLGIQ